PSPWPAWCPSGLRARSARTMSNAVRHDKNASASHRWPMSGARNIVVIGGGPAGVFAAIGARKQDPAANVTLLTDEACQPYEKPPLSKAVLLGKAAPHDAPLAGPQGLPGHGVNLVLDATVSEIDRAARAVVT